MDVETIISDLGGVAAVAAAAGVEANTVTYWMRRRRIPPQHWSAILALAKPGSPITLALLAELWGKRRKSNEAA